MTQDTILATTAADLRATLGDALRQVRVERGMLGLFFTGVKLDTGHAGLCATPLKAIPEAICCPSSAMSMPFSGKLAGKPAADLLDEALPRQSAAPGAGDRGAERAGRTGARAWGRGRLAHGNGRRGV